MPMLPGVPMLSWVPMSETLRIRSSMLPGYPDCPRRAAAKSFRKVITAAGYELRELRPSVGAAVGTAVHKALELPMRAKLETGELGRLEDGIDAAMAEFDKETAPGCEWDDTTGNRDAAQHQIIRMARAWYHGPGQQVQPLAIEVELQADAGNGFLLTGHADLVTVDGWVRDWKTGALVRPYFHQLGAYGLLVRSCGILPGVAGLGIDFIKRTPKTKPQDQPLFQPYPVAPCQRAAWSVIQRVKQDVGNFRESGDAEVFPANCMSMMCSPLYCPAHGTDFCELTKGR